jgi:hypothetical protein
MCANHGTGRFAEDFCASAWTRIEACVDQLRDNVLVLHLVEMSKVVQLDHGKSLEM